MTVNDLTLFRDLIIILWCKGITCFLTFMSKVK